MIAIWLATLILAGAGVAPALELATWFGQHVLATILLLLVLG